ncbi:transposase [Rhizobium terrae]|uniref:transposase n=1 Tax=Rhizobium terrae TaxID=2171756 RepID=UPI001D029C54|nr:transposase [Rhizobium terrae]
MSDEEAQMIADVIGSAETEHTTAPTLKKASRVRKAPSDKQVAIASPPAKLKTRGLDAQEKLELIQQVEVQVAGGKTLKDAVKSLGISDQTYYMWRKAAAQPVAEKPATAISSDDEFAEFTQLEEENRHLRALLSEKLRAENAELRKRLGMS